MPPWCPATGLVSEAGLCVGATAVFFTGFLAAGFLTAGFFAVVCFPGAFFAGIGMVMPGMCICAGTGVGRAASESALAARKNLVFTSVLRMAWRRRVGDASVTPATACAVRRGL